MLSRVRDGRLDFAVAHVSLQTLDAEFEGVELFPVQLTVGLRTRHPMRNCRSLRELHAAEWVLPGEGELGRESVASLFSTMGLTPPARVIFGESVTVALGLMGQMDLAGLFVEPLVDLAFKRHGIRRVEVKETPPALTMCVIKRKDQRLRRQRSSSRSASSALRRRTRSGRPDLAHCATPARHSGSERSALFNTCRVLLICS